MSRPFSDKLRKITPYVPGEQSRDVDLIKLNANENPYPPSPKVIEAISSFDSSKLRLYPDSACSELTTTLAKHYRLNHDQVFVGNGSDDVIALCYLSFFNSEKPILFPDITYSFYPVWCDLFGVSFDTRAVDDNFEICPEDYCGPNGGVIIPNPNAPTGIGMGKEQIEKILCQNKDCIVIIDEAYVDFGGYSCIELIEKYDNLVVVGTFSKSRSLAGLRVGFAAANAELIALLGGVKDCYNSYTLDSLAMRAACESVKDHDYFIAMINKVIDTRERTAKRLVELGFSVCPSQTNFLLATHEKLSAKDIFAACREQKIFIRYFNLPRIDNHLRITIGTDEQMQRLLSFLEQYVGKKGNGDN